MVIFLLFNFRCFFVQSLQFETTFLFSIFFTLGYCQLFLYALSLLSPTSPFLFMQILFLNLLFSSALSDIIFRQNKKATSFEVTFLQLSYLKSFGGD